MIHGQLLFIDLIYYRPYSTVAMPATLNGMLRNCAFQVISAPQARARFSHVFV